MKKRTRETLSPDLTPLIDVVFLLLIFFMVSTVFKKEELALMLNLPASSSKETKESKSENINIELSKTEIALNGKKFSINQLEDNLKQYNKKETPVFLRVDEIVEYKRVVLILDLLKKYKLSNLSLITKKD
jgi:biopolymer transport protein ExbD